MAFWLANPKDTLAFLSKMVKFKGATLTQILVSTVASTLGCVKLIHQSDRGLLPRTIIMHRRLNLPKHQGTTKPKLYYAFYTEVDNLFLKRSVLDDLLHANDFGNRLSVTSQLSNQSPNVDIVRDLLRHQEPGLYPTWVHLVPKMEMGHSKSPRGP